MSNEIAPPSAPQRSWLQDKDRQRVKAILQSDSAVFSNLAKIAGLDPLQAFRFADLSGIDFDGSDLRNFDFTGSDLSYTRWIGAIWDRTTILSDAYLDHAVGYWAVPALSSPFAPGIVATDPSSLLETDVTYDGWEVEIADRKSFYVRGFTWFRSNVLREVTNIKNFVPEMEQLMANRPSWQSSKFDLAQPYSHRQAVTASHKVPLKFLKAAQTILLCEAAARLLEPKTGIQPKEIVQRMRIIPAVFYIEGFDRSTLSALVREKEDLLDTLTRGTSQRAPIVFYDMAEGKTVTKALADKTFYILKELFPTLELKIDHTYSRRHKSSSLNENLIYAENV